MCRESATADDVRAAMPHPVAGSAADPIALEPVDDIVVTTLVDTGLSPDAMVTNAGRLGLDLSGVHAVVLSHGHFDHVGGLAGLAGRRGTRSVPMVVHPLVWTRRRLALPGGGADDWPTLSKRALTGEGFDVAWPSRRPCRSKRSTPSAGRRTVRALPG